ncbi:MAG: DNA repair and recombination protein RadB [Methanocorpusculum sp.]|nr:DNA repair and recombination protein RadB [Methanocorpusculum sp.]
MEEVVKKVSTGSSGLDELLGGGLEPKMITQFFGEAGCGKSTLCLVCAVETASRGKGVVYIDTEGFSVERFSQIAGDNTEEYAKQMYIVEPATFAEQGMMISESENLVKSGTASLIILDSATALYRVENMETKDALSMLSQQMMTLLGISKKYDVPVIITNQVFMDIERGRLKGLGGTNLSHISKAIIKIEKHEGFRRAVISKHRSQPEGRIWDFRIAQSGVEDKK